MNKRAQRLPPALPSHFIEPARAWAMTLFVIYAMGLAFGPGLLSYWMIAYAGWSIPALLIPVTALTVAAGFGFYVVGTIAHEGFHFTLARHKLASALIGTWFSAAVFAFFGVGFYLIHSRHHRHTNAVDDPDFQLFSKFNSTWQRLLVLRLVNNRGYLKLVARLLIKNELPAGIHTIFSLAELKFLAIVNVAAQLFWIGVYVTLFTTNPTLGLCVVLLPHAATAAISATIVFVQHADTGDQLFDNSRSHSSPWATLLMGGTNYHLEHHLYPRVPCWRLPRVHRWLQKTEWALKNPLLAEHRFFAGLALVAGHHRYGSAAASQSTARRN
ncbi:beta-carotene hydroxylase [Variovorax sp. OAS795]|uniref:fatty acid desaturase family protein n=1 Tax=Variovorax sp. OAS795 TaxID=3034231 RepID=UPI0033932572